MPPDRLSAQPLCDSPTRPEASIPRQPWAKPQRWRDIAVNMQLGPFVVVLFEGVMLIFAPGEAELALFLVPLLLPALRRSFLRYRHIRIV
ncbi:hypothetical protein [Streptomyces sp. NPDC048436]|uniref:hypothetical protein n=1 Tax=Streptomyces sp. NPDC048436 TaxID=3365550 RepID=UPI0037212F93